MACILENSIGGSRKTRLIYRCNLSVTQFALYKDCLVEVGLLRSRRLKKGVEMYKTTKKGKEFLMDCEKIKRIMNGMRF